MANADSDLTITAFGAPGSISSQPVDGGAHIYKGTLVSQLTGTGMVVPYSTASTSACIGVAQHEADNSSGSDGDKRVLVETDRVYAFTNGTAGDAFSEASLIGSIVYATDDHTVADNSNSAARKAVGFFRGMEADGTVRVRVNPDLAMLVNALATLTDAPATADALRDNIVSQLG